MFKIMLLVITALLSIQCQSQTEATKERKIHQEQIIQEHVYSCADKINYFINMKEYQECLDAGLKKDSTIAYLWQQKAMPFYKTKKYKEGKPLLDKAVQYDEKRWLSYRGFMKCIFSKDYKGSIEDFEKCIRNWGDSYEMDHTYSFYIGLSYLQLNEFKKAENYLKRTIEKQKKKFNEAHHLDLFYYAIAKYEQKNYDVAVKTFDEVLSQYPEFSDAIYYKALCFYRLNKSVEEYQDLIKQSEEFAKRGYTINEDNVIYEQYPYQIKWKNNF